MKLVGRCNAILLQTLSKIKHYHIRPRLRFAHASKTPVLSDTTTRPVLRPPWADDVLLLPDAM